MVKSKKTAELGKILNAHIIIKGPVNNDSSSRYFYSDNFKIGHYSIKYNISLSAINIKTAQINGWGNPLAYITRDKGPNEEFDVYVVH